MSLGLAARTVLVCMVVLMGGISRADRRPVAVIDLSGAPEAAKLASDIRGELGPHLDLKPVLSQFDESALTEPIGDEDAVALADAQRESRDASAELAAFHYPDAVNLAKLGQERLLVVTPSATQALHAELATTYAIALFGQHDVNGAIAAFALVRKLAPAHTLDPALYEPDLVAAFEAAKPGARTGMIEIKGAGTAWLDGTELGAAPQTIAAPVGLHYAQLTGPERETRGTSIVIVTGATSVTEIPDAPASHNLQIHRARTVLAKTTDAVSRASAMQHLATLVGVADAVLIVGESGKLQVATWRASRGFTLPKDVAAQKPSDILTPIEPPRPPIKPPPPIIIPIIVPHWYEDRRLQVSAAAVVLTSIIVAILWARSNVDSQPPNTNPTFKGMP